MVEGKIWCCSGSVKFDFIYQQDFVVGVDDDVVCNVFVFIIKWIKFVILVLFLFMLYLFLFYLFFIECGLMCFIFINFVMSVVGFGGMILFIFVVFKYVFWCNMFGYDINKCGLVVGKVKV